jgi:hypothetical protein
MLIIGGTIGATIGVARTLPNEEGWQTRVQVHWGLTIVSFTALISGLVLRFVSIRQDRAQTERHESSLAELRALLEGLIAGLDEIRSELERAPGIDFIAANHDVYQQRLTALLTGPVATIIQNRHALANVHGMWAYSTVMAPFAQAERYLNRAWSTSTDGYYDDMRESLRHAAAALAETKVEFGRLVGRPSTSGE